MDRRVPALAALFLFVLLTGVAIVLGGARAGTGQGIAPNAVQFAGYASALLSAALLLGRGGAAPRPLGAVVLGATVVMALVDVLTMAQDGADIGAGLVRVVCLGVIGVVTARLAIALAADRRTAP
ncbi:hypothetical protein [Blastococcus saxobsidens]|uniref:Uncharacterized protein n=1 Tax=Blastococcus saxobsidens TaxID=138336 RepID=A0A4Q7Y8X4_9ACTN|nr:hypothetical protein [Blastococcus saxobsidens]RZU33562.1 hypothetical protein BKA19_3294 [Blastococcus saxobsidens]